MPRRLLSRWFARRRGTLPLILMYHRVARVSHDPWGLCVEPERFADQMRWLAHERRVLPMTEFVGRHAANALPADAVAITFDDGYLDNLEAACPILAEFGLPATVFVVSGAIGTTQGFWWDELVDLVLLGPAADSAIEVGGERIALRWDERPAEAGWRAADAPAGPREAAYLALWQRLQRLSDGDRQAVMAALRVLLPLPPRSPARALGDTELSALIAGGTFSLGGHTVTHPALTTLSAEACRAELVASVAFCRSAGQVGPVGFAYPYGDLNERVRQAAIDSDIAWACTTRRGGVAPGADPLTLPRMMVENWSMSEFIGHLEQPVE